MRATKETKDETREQIAKESVQPLIDEELSRAPFFEVYRYPGEPNITTSIKRALAMTTEVPIAKLFAIDIMGNPKLFVFTNHALIVLALSVEGRRALWSLIGKLKRIPVVGWILAILIALIKNLSGKLLKSNYKDAIRLISLSDKAIIEIMNSKTTVTKLTKGVYGSRKSYFERFKEFEPSLGVSIQYRNYSYALNKIGTTTVRVLPVWRWLELASSAGGAAEYILPDREVIPKIGQLLQALPESVPAGHIIVGTKEIRVLWPEGSGMENKRLSVGAAATVTLLLFCVSGFWVVMGMNVTVGSNMPDYVLAILAGLGAIQTLILGRSFGYALYFGLLPTLIAMIGFIFAIIDK